MSTYKSRRAQAHQSTSRIMHKFLVSTALTAASLAGFASQPALANDNPWSQWVTEHGYIDISFDTLMTLITQHSDIYIGTSGNLNIPEGYTVRISGGSLFAAKAAPDADPTRILGSLISDGNVIIIDRNGVFFGSNSTVDVNGLVATSGTIDNNQIINNDFGSYTIDNIGADPNARIDMHGMINVADAGLAAFVAPTVTNSGIINARLGRVGFASGEKVTIDPYGDQLFEIEVPGNVAAMIDNSGAINAEGGMVVMSTRTAEGIVDNMINVSGIVNVASASVQGGKIVLSAGNGNVNVSGTLDASGAGGGGSVNVTGKNIDITESAVINADAIGHGNGGSVNIIADDVASFRGRINARGGAYSGNGGSVNVSGYEGLDYRGLADLTALNGQIGHLLLDPRFIIIHDGSFLPGIFQQYILSAQILALQLAFANVTLQADEFIDVGATGNYNVNIGALSGLLNAFLNGLSTGDINLSHWNFLGSSLETNGTLTLQSNTVNFNNNLFMGNGGVNVNAGTINLDARLYGLNAANAFELLGDGRLNGTGAVHTINILSNAASINQGLHFADDAAALTTINVGAGTYNESVLVNKSNVWLQGAGTASTTIDPNSPGFHVTGDDVTITGFNINTGDDGVLIDGADRANIFGNLFTNQTSSAIRITNGSNDATIGSNIMNLLSGVVGVFINGGADHDIQSNTINGGLVGIYAQGNVDNLDIVGNTIGLTTGTSSDAIRIVNNTGSVNISTNHIYNAGWDGVNVQGGTGQITVNGNDIHNVVGASGIAFLFHNNVNSAITNNFIDGTDRLGIYVWNTNGLDIVGNNINNTGREAGWWGAGIHLEGANDTLIEDNTISNTGGSGIYIGAGNNPAVQTTSGNRILNNHIGYTEIAPGVYVSAGNGNIGGDGVYVNSSNGVVIQGNTITETRFNVPDSNGSNGSGIQVINTNGAIIGGAGALRNTITNADWDGIRLQNNSNVSVVNNYIDGTGRVGIWGGNVNGATIANNIVRNDFLGGYGSIHADGGANWNISGNNVDFGDYGIFLNGTGGLNTITGNQVDNVTIDGIRVVGVNGNAAHTLGAIISGNFVGLNGGNIGGHGISLLNSSYAVVDSNQVQRTGLDAINAYNADNISITGNQITRAGRDGIHVEESDLAYIGANTIFGQNAGFFGVGAKGANRHGIFVSGGYGAIINANTIRGGNGALGLGGAGAGADGIHVENSASATITNNNILGGAGIVGGNGANGYGIYAINSGGVASLGNGILITGNTIDGGTLSLGAGLDGIYVANSEHGILAAHLAIISGNTVSGVGGNGIYVTGTNDVIVASNTVSLTGDHGIFVNDSVRANISGNIVSLTDGYGVYLLNSARSLIQGNTVGLTGDDGIFVDGSNRTRVYGNTVALTDGDGIRVNNSTGIDIQGNDVSLANGNGIFVTNSQFANLFDNSVLGVDLDGIRLVNSANSTIEENLIIGAGDDGIDVENSNRTDILDNTVLAVDDNGIEVSGSNNVDVLGNAVVGAGNNGIDLRNSNNADIEGNVVLGTGNNGIFVSASNFVNVAGNIIGNTVNNGIRMVGGIFNTISDNLVFLAGNHGISVDNSDFVDVTGNLIVSANRDGINVNNSDFADINGNLILFAGNDGINVNNSDFVDINGNLVAFAGNDGVDVNDSDFADINGNVVAFAGDNGIELSNSAFADINGNLILFAGNDGINVNNSDFVDINGNLVAFAGNDGIDVNNSVFADINGNLVAFAGDNGIELSNSAFADINGNLILFAGDNGIDVDNSSFVDITNNIVLFAGNDGINVSDSWFAGINGNVIAFAGNDGISTDNTWFSDISGNVVVFSGDDGIQVLDSGFVGINNNLIAFAGDDGIDLNGSIFSTINSNTIAFASDNGIELDNAFNVDIDGNNISNSGNAGIAVGNASDIYVGNNVLTANNISIRFFDVQDSTIEDNVVEGSLNTGILLEDVDGINIVSNDISNSGVYGLHAAGGNNGSIVLVGNTFNDNPVGAFFESGAIDISDLSNPNIFNGGNVALRFARFDLGGGALAPLSLVGNTLGATIFSGQANFYVQLANGAFFAPGNPTIIDGRFATYDGIRPITDFPLDPDGNPILTAEALNAIESKLFDFDDLGSIGQIFVGSTVSLQIEDFFRQFGLFEDGVNGFALTIRGLPRIQIGPNVLALAALTPAAGEETSSAQDVANIEPAAGDETGGATGTVTIPAGNATASDVAAIEPAAGGDVDTCLSSTIARASQGETVTYSFGGSFEQSLASSANCGGQL